MDKTCTNKSTPLSCALPLQAGLLLSAVGLIILAYLSQAAIRLTVLCQVAMFTTDERKTMVQTLRASTSALPPLEELESCASPRAMSSHPSITAGFA